MGQYYKPIISEKPLSQSHIQSTKGQNLIWAYSHDYESGLKLMEHSWLNNTFVGVITSEILNKPMHVVWAGDYADPEEYEVITVWKNGKLEKAEANLYHLCQDKNCITKPYLSYEDQKEFVKKNNILINHSNKQFVDILKTPDNDGWTIHALPLLTCEGNGRGGGDFRGDESLVGLWARDLISISDKAPEGFEELKFDLYE